PLARSRLENGGVFLEIDKSLHAILPGESRNNAGLMLSDAAAEIVRNAEVERPSVAAGENVDIVVATHRFRVAQRRVLHAVQPAAQRSSAFAMRVPAADGIE